MKESLILLDNACNWAFIVLTLGWILFLLTPISEDEDVNSLTVGYSTTNFFWQTFCMKLTAAFVVVAILSF